MDLAGMSAIGHWRLSGYSMAWWYGVEFGWQRPFITAVTACSCAMRRVRNPSPQNIHSFVNMM
eukprot:896623-Pyramimonas_sp.AAC.1